MLNCGIIYRLISPSEKSYIGQTWNLQMRLRNYKKSITSQQPKLFNAIQKYGFDNFSVEILDMCYNQEELDDAEIYWINYYDSISNGYNCKTGGSYGKHSQETKMKMKISNKRIHSNVTKTKISKSLNGKKHLFDRVTKNIEHVFKLYDSHKNVFYTLNLYEFCRQHNLIAPSALREVIFKKRNRSHYKGWTGEALPKTTENLKMVGAAGVEPAKTLRTF
jgi:group I intron endonuclease